MPGGFGRIWRQLSRLGAGEAHLSRGVCAPQPGSLVWCADAANVAWALRFSLMKRKFVIGQMPDEEPAYANFDFISGTKGAHVNIAGISGVATKTSYALFLLYSLFASQPQIRSIIFNVKGDDLLYLDKPNSKISAKDRGLWREIAAQ